MVICCITLRPSYLSGKVFKSTRANVGLGVSHDFRGKIDFLRQMVVGFPWTNGFRGTWVSFSSVVVS